MRSSSFITPDEFIFYIAKLQNLEVLLKKVQSMKLVFYIIAYSLASLNFVVADTIKIDFTADDTYSIEVAKIDVGDTIEWLPKNIPDDDETSIVHGDYRLDNMIFNDNHEVIGVLDWELSTLGHPIADFNYHCLNWRTIPQLQDEKYCIESGIPSEKEYMDMYAMRTGKDLNKHWEFYTIFNIFKIAAILQGILGRVRDGTATSKHAEERGMQVYPLSEAAWNNVLKEYS